MNLFIASYNGHESTVKLLIEANADVNIKVYSGYTALHEGKS